MNNKYGKLMTIKDAFLNANINFDEAVSQEKKEEISNQINSIKDILNGKDVDLTLSKNDLDNLCKWFNIDTSQSEERDFIKELIQKVEYKSGHNYPVVFTHNLLYINPYTVEEYIKADLNEEIVRELIQLVTLIKLEKSQSLKEIAKIGTLEFDTVYDMSELMQYEKDIENKIKKTTNFASLINYLSPFENDFSFTEEGKKKFEKVVYELETLVFYDTENENLIEFNKDKICFNEHSFNEYQKVELNDDRKRELIQSLYLVVSNQEDTNEYSGSLFEKKQQLIHYLQRKVSIEEINEAIEKIPGERQILSENNKEKLFLTLKVNDTSRFMLFEQGIFNDDNFDALMTEEYKDEQIILYFIILCAKESKEIYCRFINNETIQFNQFEKYFYIEDILQKKLSEYTLNDILSHLHEFKKDKIFTKENEMIMDTIISEKLVQKYSFNTTNKEVLFINSSRCVFNEKLMSKINEFELAQLIEIYLITNKTLREELSENIVMDKRVDNSQKYEESLKDKLKYKITEKDIQEAIESIESKSNTLISSKDKIFQMVSIELNAKEVKEISNDIVDFSYRNQELYLYGFNENMCEKLLKKELVDLSKREFAQALLLSEIKQKNVILKNPEGNEIKVHENFKEVEKYHDMIIDKISYQITEEQIDKALKIITDKVENTIKETLQYTINNIKKKCGIKVKSAFKHIL